MPPNHLPNNIITADDIQQYSICPNIYKYGYKLKNMSGSSSVIKDIIRRMFIFQTKNGKKATWGIVRSWLDRFLVKHFEGINRQTQYQIGKGILGNILDFYQGFYVDKPLADTLINVPIKYRLFNKKYLQLDIDIVELYKDKVILYDIIESKERYQQDNLYNDIRLRANIVGFEYISRLQPIQYIRIVIRPQIIKMYTLNINENMFKNSQKIISHLAHGLCCDVFYPARSIQCSQCPHLVYCSI